jgi:hypothetical protein
MINGAEIVAAVLDDLNRSGVIETWSRATKFIPGDDARARRSPPSDLTCPVVVDAPS